MIESTQKTPTFSNTQMKEKPRRLPCRGCTQQCSNYLKCDGKLWRMNLDDANLYAGKDAGTNS